MGQYFNPVVLARRKLLHHAHYLIMGYIAKHSYVKYFCEQTLVKLRTESIKVIYGMAVIKAYYDIAKTITPVRM